MTDITAISEFFAGWGEPTTEGRAQRIGPALGAEIHYADPHTPTPITSADELLNFVAGFTANAPGASVTVLDPIDVHNGHFRCSVQFDMGPDMSMIGQYFGELDKAGKIIRIVGFVGKGAE